MSENVRYFLGWFFWLLLIALFALNASAFSTIIDTLGRTLAGVGRSVLVTSNFGDQRDGRLLAPNPFPARA